jgi:iron complex outermembrane recepter protein
MGIGEMLKVSINPNGWSIQRGDTEMPDKTLIVRSVTALAICGFLLHPGIASAQSATPSGSALEEIVVTAEKRSESIQEVPIAITAFSESLLRSKGITDLHGLSALTPNVTLDQGSPFSGSNSVLSASIRGRYRPG